MAQRPKPKSMNIPEFTEETEVQLARLGSSIVFATDEWFAEAKNLLNHTEPQFDPDAFTTYGKLMDGWESRRKRIPGHDWSIIELGLSGKILGFDVNTSWFTGNYVPRCSIQATCVDEVRNPSRVKSLIASLKNKRVKDRIGTAASNEEVKMANELYEALEWDTVVEYSELGAGYEDTCHNYFKVDSKFQKRKYTHLRLNMFPDGGIARLKVYGRVSLPVTNNVIDLVAVENGGRAVGCSNKHYGEPKNMINPGRGINMGDGWETARKLTRPAMLEVDPNNPALIKVPGSDFVILQLGSIGKVSKIEVDTCWFKGNFPESCTIECAGSLAGDEVILRNADLMKMDAEGKIPWKPLLPRTKLSADKQHYYTTEIANHSPIQYVKVIQFPDGGISRVRLLGTRDNSFSSKL